MINIYFNDLNFEKQEEIRGWIREEVIQNLNNEAMEKGKTLNQLLEEDYDLGYDLSEEERKRNWQILVENFIDRMVEDRLSGWQCVASWR
jgi:N-acetyl-anhydromuramyl-L-alanine amidase AmpD